MTCFLDYLNDKYSAIKFTAEYESDKKLDYFDVIISRKNNSFSTSVYQKSKFPSLGISFFSICCKKFKINAIRKLIHRVYGIRSDYSLLHKEFEYIERIFQNNGYLKNRSQSVVNDVLSTSNDELPF